MEKRNHPPIILVRTWCDLLKNAENKEAKHRAQEMLLGAFGDEQAIIEFLKIHNIRDNE